MVLDNGSLTNDQSKINPNATVTGAATDGITKMFLVADATSPVTFSLFNPKDGSLYSLDRQVPTNSPITIDPKNGKAVCVYQVPDGYGANNPPAGRTINVRAFFTNDSSQQTNVKISLITPPVVFVHGMWSDPTLWTSSGFVTKIANSGFRFTPILADYSLWSATTFDPFSPNSIYGRGAVQSAIENALNAYRKDNIAVSQVDVVGHSLGGLMARSFSQQGPFFFTKENYKHGYIHKLITLGTPTKGSPLGPLLYNNQNEILHLPLPGYLFGLPVPLGVLMSIANRPIGECHRDFDEYGPVIQNNLLASTSFYTYAIGGDYGGNIKNDISYSAVSALSFILGGQTHEQLFHIDGCNNSEPDNDIIVPMYSQMSGLKFGQVFSATSHIKLVPGETSETNNPLIQQKVVELLLSDDLLKFNIGYPKASVINDNCDHPNVTARLAPFPDINSSATVLRTSTTSDNQMVKIISPIKNSVFQQNSNSKLTLTYDVLNGAIPIKALFMIQGAGWYSAPILPPYSTIITLPDSLQIGKLNIILLARDTTGVLMADTASIVISPNGRLDSLSVSPKQIVLDSALRIASVNVQGYYTNGLSNYQADVSDSSAGTTYKSQNGNSIFKISSNGLITALNAGTDTLLVSNNGKSTKMPVTVGKSFLQGTLYRNYISLQMIPDKQATDPPFLVIAGDSAAEKIDFNLIKGNVTLQDGIITIKGPGQVSIRASANGNAYFLKPPDVQQNFCINPLPAKQIIGDTNSCIGSSKFYSKRDNTLKYNDSATAYNWTVIGGTITKKVGDTAYINWSTAGTQTLQVQPEVDGCKGKAISINVSVNPVSAPTITASGPTSFCNNDSVVISSTNATAYQWYKNDTAIVNATGQSITVRSSGKYSVKTTNSSGCTAVSTAVNVDVTNAANPPIIAAQGPTNVCKGDSVVLASSSSTGNQWYRNDTLVQGATANTYAVKKSGNYSVQVKSGSCSSALSSSITVLVNTPPSPSISASGQTTFCEGSNVQLKTDTTYNNYQWFKDGNAITNATSRTYFASQAGNYTVSVGSNGCTAISQPIKLTVTTNNSKPTITSSGPSSFCADSSVTLVSSASTGNQWYRNDTLINGATATSYKATTSGIYTVKANVGTCSNVVAQPVTLSVIPLPTGSIQSSSLQLCPSKGATLTASGGTSYEWYFNNTLVAGASGNTLNATRAGTYSATIINNGCRAKAQNQVTLSLPPKPSISFSFDSYCKNQPVLFVNNSSDTAVSYQWLFGDSFSSTNKSPTHVYTQAATFKVTLTENLRSCPEIKDSFSKNIVIQEPRFGIKYPVVQTSIGSTLQLAARTIGKDYVWKPSTDLNNAHIPNPVLMVKSDRLYLIEITSDAGCITVDTLEVLITKGSRIDVPKAFTPNGDGVNDLLRPIVQNIVSLKFFRVYNRWGQLVYETKTIGQGWDGTFNGQRQPVETYTWAVEGVDADGKTIKASGKSLLIR
jgi:gliding motility-associated-like protein